jgi:hypothetical protein
MVTKRTSRCEHDERERERERETETQRERENSGFLKTGQFPEEVIFNFARKMSYCAENISN